MVETLIWLIIWLLIIGVLVWAATVVVGLLPIDARFKQIIKVIIYVVALIVLLIQLMSLLGATGPPVTAPD